MSSKKLLKWSILTGVVILICLSLGTIGFMYAKVNAFSKVFAKNVYIENLAMGGLTKAEAKAQLQQNISKDVHKQQIVFTDGTVSETIPLDDFGLTYNIDEIIEKAFQIGHDENFFEQYRIAQKGLNQRKNFVLERSIDENKITEQLEKCQDTFYIEPINATLERINHEFIITKETNGMALDIDATKTQTLETLAQIDRKDNNDVIINVVKEEIPAEYTEDSFAHSQTLVASFSTSYNNANANRNENLKVAAQKIGCMLLPDEVFYLSNRLEPFTEAEGYKNAATIINGKLEDSLGGGICQVASTLYNAVLLTELEVVYRQNHSLAVSYVPLGRDATYSTDAIDFKFKNNTPYPLVIESYCANNEVIVNIFGDENLKSPYTVKFESEVTEVIPAPETKYEDDATLEKGKEIVEVKALDGKRVNLYKLYYNGNQLVERVLINKSYYKPRAATIKRGIKVVKEEEKEKNDDSTNTSMIPQQKPNTIPTPTTPIPDTMSNINPNEQIDNSDGFAITQE